MNLPINYLLTFLLMFFYFSCTETTSLSHETTQTGTLEIRVWIPKLNIPPETGVRDISWDRLVIQVWAHDMDTVRDTFSVEANNPFFTGSLSNITTGTDRKITAWTLDKSGDIIHMAKECSASIGPGQTVPLVLICDPIVGSIYLQLTSFPDRVDSVVCAFSSSDTLWECKEKKSNKVHLCLDKIPFGTRGDLSIVGYTENGDTVAAWHKNNFTFTNTNVSMNVSFIKAGKVDIQVTMKQHGITLIHGIMNTTDSLGDEKGGLIISEIMYSANDSEYIELYNPQNSFFQDTIIIQKDFGVFRYYEVSIPPMGFYVIGRRDLPWADTYHATSSALDFSSTGGNWVLIRSAKDSTIYDLVAFQGGANAQQWPNFSTSRKASIQLDSLSHDPEYNNFGRNWKQARVGIDTTQTMQLGTPGSF